MNNRRRPNTENWKLIERTFRMISGPGWRRTAADLLGVDRSELRDRYDRADLSGAELDTMHSRLKAAIVRHRKAAEADVKCIHAVEMAVGIAQDDRLTVLLREAAAEAAVRHAEEFAVSPIGRIQAAFFADLMEDA